MGAAASVLGSVTLEADVAGLLKVSAATKECHDLVGEALADPLINPPAFADVPVDGRALNLFFPGDTEAGGCWIGKGRSGDCETLVIGAGIVRAASTILDVLGTAVAWVSALLVDAWYR